MAAKIAQFRYLSRNIAVNSDILIEIRSYIPILSTTVCSLASSSGYAHIKPGTSITASGYNFKNNYSSEYNGKYHV